jgi:hypothetical protein
MEGFIIVMSVVIPLAFLAVLSAAFVFGLLRETHFKS